MEREQPLASWIEEIVGTNTPESLNDDLDYEINNNKIISERNTTEITTEYLTFIVYQEKNKKTKNISIWNKTVDVHLGEIRWYGAWRKYVFYPESETLFDTKCLNDIISFINKLMAER